MKYIFLLFFKTILCSESIFSVEKSLIDLHENEVLGIDEIEKTRDIVPDTIRIDELKQHLNTEPSIDTSEYKKRLYEDNRRVIKNLKKLQKLSDIIDLKSDDDSHEVLQEYLAMIENSININSSRSSILNSEKSDDINILPE